MGILLQSKLFCSLLHVNAWCLFCCSQVLLTHVNGRSRCNQGRKLLAFQRCLMKSETGQVLLWWKMAEKFVDIVPNQLLGEHFRLEIGRRNTTCWICDCRARILLPSFCETYLPGSLNRASRRIGVFPVQPVLVGDISSYPLKHRLMIIWMNHHDLKT